MPAGEGRGGVRERTIVWQRDGAPLPLTVRWHPRARRIRLRLAVHERRIIVTLPPAFGVQAALETADRHHEWVKRQLSARPARVPFADAVHVPFLGELHRIGHRPDGPADVRLAAGLIEIGGPVTDLPRRIALFFRCEARRHLSAQVACHARSLSLGYGRISIRDGVTRWGSCGPSGNLAFSWRLVMAPWTVLDYVAAHEVAHLRERNHGERFHRLVASLIADPDTARSWLRQNGSELHRYG